MVTAVAIGAWLPDWGVGFVVATAVGGTLLVTAALVGVRAVRHPRSPLVAGGCLVGAAGVVTQLALTTGDPASRVAYLAGIAGASGWYGAAAVLLADRPTPLGRQWLGVGALLWVSGTVTITTTAASADWPLGWSLLAGVAVLCVAVPVWLTDVVDPTNPWDRGLAVLGVTLLAPALLGVLAGAEILFVAYILVFAVSLVCWSLVRLALG